MSQYAVFAITSPDVSADAMAQRLGMQPDEAKIRASRDLLRDLPRAHHWRLVSSDKNLTVDEHIRVPLDRIRPAQPALLAMLDEESGMATSVSVVRNFDDAGTADDADDTHDPMVGRRLGGQHQLLGFHLDGSVLAELVRLRAVLDVDEYG